MLWNDKEVLKILENQTKSIKDLSEAISVLGKHAKDSDVEMKEILDVLTNLNDKYHSLLLSDNKISDNSSLLENRISLLDESMQSINKILTSKIRDTEIRLVDELDFVSRGILKTVDGKLVNLGDKKGLVVELLKKIAKLEGSNVSA